MKKFILGLCIFATTVLAGQYTITPVVQDGYPVYEYTLGYRASVYILAGNSITSQGATNFLNAVQTPVIIPASTVGMSLHFKLSGAGTTPVTVTAQKSYDGQTWETLLVFAVNATGTTAVNTYTNATLNDYGYVRFLDVTNGSPDRILTNFTLKFYNK